MWKYLSLLLCLFTTTYVSSLNCYSVPFGTRIEDARDVLENCEKNSLQPLLDSSSSESCYKMVITEQGGNHTQYIGKGCMPGTSCSAALGIWDVAIKALKSEGTGLGQEVDIQCYECTQNECNSAPKFVTINIFCLFLASLMFMF